jgi:hypothetical protein
MNRRFPPNGQNRARRWIVVQLVAGIGGFVGALVGLFRAFGKFDVFNDYPGAMQEAIGFTIAHLFMGAAAGAAVGLLIPLPKGRAKPIARREPPPRRPDDYSEPPMVNPIDND